MLLGRAALHSDQIVETVPCEEVRTFDPDLLLRNIDAVVDNFGLLAHHLSPPPVNSCIQIARCPSQRGTSFGMPLLTT
jgi:hypothetical protein